MSTAVARKFPLELADVVLSATSLVITNEDGFHRAGAALVAMDECSNWWWGDYLLFAEKFDLTTVLESARSSLHTNTIWSCKEVARFYPPADRSPALSFTHHRDIRYILGRTATLKDAKKWLAKAAENGWTCGDLREQMRLAQRRSERDPGPMRDNVTISDFVKLSRRISEIDPDKIPDEQRDELRESTRPLWDFLCAIHRAQFQSLPRE